MEELILDQLLQGLKEFFGYINWVFVIALLLVSWVINVGTQSLDKSREEKNKKVMDLKWKVLITGVILACMFPVFYPDLRTGHELGRLFFGIFVAMGIHQIGLQKFMKSKK